MRISTLGFAALLALAGTTAHADPIKVLFVGDSLTFGRIDPVMSYNAANVHALPAAMWAANADGSNSFEPHPWGGVPGIFKQMTVDAGLDYDVSLSTRNAATLRGQFLNSNPANWDLRGNIASQTWNKVVLQEQSSEPLPQQNGLDSSPAYFNTYANLMENWVHQGTALTYRERDLIGGTNAACAALTGSSTGTCSLQRSIPANPNASASTQMYLYQTWARPNLVDAPFTTVTDPVTGAVTNTTTPATSFYGSLQAQSTDIHNAFLAAAALAAADGSGGFAGIAPVGDAFQLAVNSGLVTADMYAPGAGSDGLMDLWFDDGLHASKYGSYLSALTLFGSLTGLDPLSLGIGEKAAADLGITPDQALVLERVASAELGFTSAVPEPSSAALLLLGVGFVAWRKRRL